MRQTLKDLPKGISEYVAKSRTKVGILDSEQKPDFTSVFIAHGEGNDKVHCM